jgi:sRNA-binding carbon storage regulator CsrA
LGIEAPSQVRVVRRELKGAEVPSGRPQATSAA